MKKIKVVISIFMLLSIALLSVIPSLALGISSTNISVISSDLEFVMKNADNNEKIKVYLWYKDIDQKEVDVLTTKTTGLTPESCSVIEEFPSTELLHSLRKGDTEAQIRMNSYMERTESSRKAERENSNRYIKTHRKIANEMYNEKSNYIRNALSISDNDTVFSSEFAPMIIANMTKEEIIKASKNDNIEDIALFYEEVAEDPSVTEDEGVYAKQSMGLQKVYEVYNLTGEGVDVGLIESNIPGNVLLSEEGVVPQATEALEIDLDDVMIVESSNYPITPDKYTATKGHSHPYNTLRVMAGSQTGIAKEMNMYATNSNYHNIEEMIKLETDSGQVIDIVEFNLSYLIYDKRHPLTKDPDSVGANTLNFDYTSREKYFDYLVSHHNMVVVVAGGNYGVHEFDYFDYSDDTSTEEVDCVGWKPGARITSPGMAYNVITVGGYDNKKDTDPENDTLSYYSWKNSFDGQYGCEKPDVIMPKNFPGGGTSVASPALTAQLALMFELKPSLSLHPEVVKAIVLASCHRKVEHNDDQGEQEFIEQGITERQGAGAPDAWTMAEIVCQGTYGFGVMTGENEDINILQPPYEAQNMNVSIAWLRENIDTNDNSIHSNASDIVAGQASDIDLSLYQNDMEIMSSSLDYSSTEMCYVPLSLSDYRYQIKLTQNSNITDVRYGYAWSTDKMRAAPVEYEGVYYLKSASSDEYLNCDTTSESPQLIKSQVDSQNDLSDSYQWVIKQNANTHRVISGCTTTQMCIRESDELNGTSVLAQLSADMQNVNINYNEDGTISILNLSSDRILSNADSTLIWETYDSLETSINEEQKWYIEKVNYLRGDANVDGFIGNPNGTKNLDQTIVQRYLVGVEPLTNLQLYLSDMNRDGVISIFDATLIQSITNDIYSY